MKGEQINLAGSPESLDFTDSPKFLILEAYSQISKSLYPQSACLSSNPAMSKKSLLRELLPREKELSMRYLETHSSTKQRRVSLACTECQKRKSKVRNIVPHSMMELTQCSAPVRPHARNVGPKVASACMIQPVIGDARFIPPSCSTSVSRFAEWPQCFALERRRRYYGWSGRSKACQQIKMQSIILLMDAHCMEI